MEVNLEFCFCSTQSARFRKGNLSANSASGLNSSVPAAQRLDSKWNEAVGGFSQQVESLRRDGFSINLVSFWRVNTAELSLPTSAAALLALLKAASRKHASLHEDLKYLPQRPCCGLLPLLAHKAVFTALQR